MLPFALMRKCGLSTIAKSIESMFWTQYCNTILSKENNFFCYLNIYTLQACILTEKKMNKKKLMQNSKIKHENTKKKTVQ